MIDIQMGMGRTPKGDLVNLGGRNTQILSPLKRHKCLKQILDVPTRWSSTYHMAVRSYDLRNVSCF